MVYTNHSVCICICVSLPCEAHVHVNTLLPAKDDFCLVFQCFSELDWNGYYEMGRSIMKLCQMQHIHIHISFVSELPKLLKPISWGINSIGKIIYITKFA